MILYFSNSRLITNLAQIIAYPNSKIKVATPLVKDKEIL